MRVGIFCPTLNVYGGGEFVASVMANTLARNKYEVTLFTNNEIKQEEIKRFFGENLHPSIKIILKPPLFQPRGLLDFYQTIFRSYIFKLKCDLWIDVYSNRIFPWTNISYIHFPFLNRLLYKPEFPFLKNANPLAVAGLPYAIFEKNLTSSNGKLILTNSQYTAEEIKKCSGKNAKVLYPPVPSTMFDNQENLTKNQRKNLVITVSRFEPGKGLEKIPYIALLTDKDIKFAIIGRTHYKHTLLSLRKLTKKLALTDRIKFFPDLPITEMKNILRKAKIYLHTMVGEHFGISIVQAMAIGCIPIVHNSGGAKEFVPNGFRYNNIQEAATKITNEIYQWSPSKAQQIIKIAERFREENFSEEFMKLFEKYIENNFCEYYD